MNRKDIIERMTPYVNQLVNSLEAFDISFSLTDGDFDNISVGRNAIFYDRNGLDWDATIIKIIDNPISIRQAFWSPYRKVSKFISSITMWAISLT